jgi:hypothetical protein
VFHIAINVHQLRLQDRHAMACQHTGIKHGSGCAAHAPLGKTM